jgi:hypothetical protein
MTRPRSQRPVVMASKLATRRSPVARDSQSLVITKGAAKECELSGA